MINLSDETLSKNEGEKETVCLEGNKESLEEDSEKEMECMKSGNKKESDTKNEDTTETMKYTIVLVKHVWPTKVVGETEVEYTM